MESEDDVATRELEDIDVHSDSDEPPSGQSPQERFTSRNDEQNAAVMPVSEVSVILQAMREEQLQTLNRIADGVQQLQSQVLVMGETATATDASMRLCLERLSGLEVRIGSIPVPIKAPDSFQPHNQNKSQLSRGSAVGGGFTPVVGRMDVPRVSAFAASPYAPSSSLPTEVAPPPPPPAPSPARVPSWMDRSIEREPAQPHFMRSASAQPRPGYAKGTNATTVSPVSGSFASVTGSTVQASPPAAAASTAEPAVISPEEEAKEAKRKAFIEDRARIQARIAARKANTNAGVSSSKNSATMPVAPSAPPLPEDQQTLTQGGFGSDGSAGMFYGNPGFVGGGVVEEGTGETTAEDRAEWLERERALRERKEKERLEAAERERKRREEEEARIEREKAEAKRRKEEEEARVLREAEEARERERKRREMEAKRQAKTRVIMSSLFDTGETGGGSSLFGGLGAALPAGGSVFDDGGGSITTATSYNSGGGGGGGGGEGMSFTAASASPVTDNPPEDGAKTGASSAVPVSALAYPIGGSAGGGGSLFAGMDDIVKASRGGLFDGIDTPASPVARRPSPEEVIETRSYSRGGEDSFNPESLGLFDRSPRRDDPAAATACAEEAAGPAVIGSGEDEADADDEIDRIFSSDGIEGGGDGYRGGKHNPAEQDDYDYNDDDFLSAVSGRGDMSSAIGESSVRGGSLFPQDDDDQQDNDDEGDNIFASSFPGRGGGKDVSTISAAEVTAAVGGGGSGGHGSGASLFDRPEFSIGGIDDDGGVFGKGSGGGGGGGVSEVEGNGSSAAFLTALGELDLGSQGQGQAAPDRDGMVDVTL